MRINLPDSSGHADDLGQLEVVKMSKTGLQRLLAAFLVLTLLVSMTSIAAIAAPVSQQVAATEVAGTIDGAAPGEFPRIWLGLETEPIGQQTTVTIEWDRFDTENIGFYVLDAEDLTAVIDGTDPRVANLGTSETVVEGPGNQEAVTFRATSDRYTIIVFNDSPQAASFTLSTNNGVITNDDGSVTDPSAPADEEADEVGEEATATPVAEEEGADAGDEAAATPTPEEETAAATPVAEEESATATPVPAEEEAAAPAAVSAEPVAVEATEMVGQLPTQDSQHYLGLSPDLRDANITLSMTFEPQDQEELARRLNFWVLDQQGFDRYAAGDARLSSVAIAAGSTNVNTAANEREANFTASGTADYTVIVYNSSNISTTYTLAAENAMLMDDSGQTLTAQEAQPAAAAAPADDEDEAADAETADEGDDATTPARPAGERGEPGGTYTVQSGDTLALIAADVYGDFRLYEELCAFNNIDDCDRIEVGDVINLPTTDEIGSGATAAPAAAETEVETPAATATETVTGTTSLTGTAAVTTTDAVTGTDTVTDTEAAADDEEADAAEGDLVDVLVASGNYRTLLSALEAASLVDALRADGPFTVFAPTDAAFEALEEAAPGALQELLADPGGQLTQILLYHVASGEVLSEDVTSGMEVATLQGDSASLEIRGDAILINGANVSDPDLAASNGVAHGIDAVLIPPSFGQ
jgi:uncharacterized surface protein with fasciclin (FAS1) repeats